MQVMVWMSVYVLADLIQWKIVDCWRWSNFSRYSRESFVFFDSALPSIYLLWLAPALRQSRCTRKWSCGWVCMCGLDSMCEKFTHWCWNNSIDYSKVRIAKLVVCLPLCICFSVFLQCVGQVVHTRDISEWVCMCWPACFHICACVGLLDGGSILVHLQGQVLLNWWYVCLFIFGSACSCIVWQSSSTHAHVTS